MEISFRKFLEFEKASTDYASSLNRWLGISPDIMKQNPVWAPQLNTGKYSYNGMMVQVVDVETDDQGQVVSAVIKPMNDPAEFSKRAFMQHRGKSVELPSQHPETRTMKISGKEYNALIAGKNPTPDMSAMGLPGGM